MTSRVIVTGGAGFIGSHVCKQLASRGYRPVLRRFVGERLRVGGALGPLEQLDVRDEAGLDDVFRRHPPAAGMHLGAYIQLGDWVREPLEYHRDNPECEATCQLNLALSSRSKSKIHNAGRPDLRRFWL